MTTQQLHICKRPAINIPAEYLNQSLHQEFDWVLSTINSASTKRSAENSNYTPKEHSHASSIAIRQRRDEEHAQYITNPIARAQYPEKRTLRVMELYSPSAPVNTSKTQP
jgi:hypothetical protein